MSKFSSHLRSGQDGIALEQIWKALNKARGSAYAAYHADNVDPTTIVEVENFAIAKAIFEVWESNQRLANQFDPNKMGLFIERWEKILRITPDKSSTNSKRKEIIAAKMRLWTQNPTRQSVIDLVKTFIGDVFVELETNTQNDVPGFVDGGADLTSQGGALLADGEWTSQVAHFYIRTWRPRDKDGNYLMSASEYETLSQSYIATLQDWLPCWVTFSWYEFPFIDAVTPGCMSGIVGRTQVTGSGTSFLTTFEAGDEFEIVSNSGNLFTFTVDEVVNDTTMNIEETIIEAFSCSEYRVLQFILDLFPNLDIAPLS